MTRFLLSFVLLHSWLLSYSQTDSLTVFFVGKVKGERFHVYWNGRRMLDFVGTDSYKYAFKIPKEETWAKKGYIEKLTVYRKGKLGLKYHDTGFFSGYESKKYLVIYRNPLLRNRSAVNPVWSDIEPKRPSGH